MNDRNRRRFIGLTVLYVIAAALETLSISALLPLFSAFLEPSTGRGVLLQRVLLVFALFLWKNAYLYCVSLLRRKYILSRYKAASENLFRSYLDQPYSFHIHQNSAVLINNINIHTVNYFNYWQSVMDLIREGTVALGLFALMLVVRPAVTLAVAAVLTVVTLLLKTVVYPRIRKSSAVSSRAYDGMHITVFHGLQSIREVKTYSVEDRVCSRYSDYIGENTEAKMKAAYLSALPSRLVEMTAVTCLLALLLLGSGSGIETRILSGTAVLAAGFIKLMPTVMHINETLSAMARYKASYDRGGGTFIRLLKEAEERSETSAEKEKMVAPGESGAYSIVFRDVGFCYENDSRIFRDLSLKIDRGEVIGFKGPSGAGKSTLIALLLGLLQPQEGEIFVDRDGGEFPVSSVNIGYIPQDLFIMDASIRENILFYRDYDPEKLESAIRLARLDPVIAGLEKGVNTVIGERGVLLSGGQNQRIVIARALYGQPDLLLLDEATSSLDNALEKEIMDDIYRLRGDLTIVISAHRLSTLEGCDRIYEIDEGAAEEEIKDSD